jgi:hypothetical protein
LQKYQVIVQLCAVLTALIIALFSPYIIERWKRKFKKSNIDVIDILEIHQNSKYNGRLIIKNNSKARALNVEAYVEYISDNGKLREGFLPVPLNWTHGHLTNSLNSRYINGYQTVHLDIYCFDSVNKKVLLQTPINIAQFNEIKNGKTELRIKLYQESGDVVPRKVIVTWDGQGLPQSTLGYWHI